MNTKRAIAAVAGALIAGLVLGNVVSSFAATSGTSSGTTTATAGLGGRLGAAMRDSGGRLLDIVAKLTGKSTTELAPDRQAGKTLAQIANANGVSTDKVVDEALRIRRDALAAKVKAGEITQAQADAAAANMKTRVTDRVNAVNTACDGTGSGGGRGAGAKCGNASGTGVCDGSGAGRGGNGAGRGAGGASCGANSSATN